MDYSKQVRETFGARLKELRLHKGENQVQCAEALGFDKTRYSKWESCTAYPEAGVLWALADYFDTTVDYLIGRSGMRIDSNVKIAEVTNLSEVAIERIKQMKTMGFSDVLSMTIFNEGFISAVSWLNKLRSPILSWGNVAVIRESDIDAIKEGIDCGYNIMDIGEFRKVYITRAKEELSRVIDEVAEHLQTEPPRE